VTTGLTLKMYDGITITLFNYKEINI